MDVLAFGDERLPERFWSKVKVQPTGCWRWTATGSDGYGLFRIGERHYRAHRVAYESLVGPIGEGLQLDHQCHTQDVSCPGGAECPHRRCVNPAHLQQATNRENALRGRSFSAENAVKTHCPQGHRYDVNNTYVDRVGWRHCRTCKRDRRRKNNEKASTR